MRTDQKELQQLIEFQELEIEIAKLKQHITELATGKSLEALRDEILQLSQAVSQERINYEELEREQSRILGDLKLVEDRIARDKDRLNKTAISRDAIGIQHELETLSKRKSELEDMEIAVLEKLEESKKLLEANSAQKLEREQNFNQSKDELKHELVNQKSIYDSKLAASKAIREGLGIELVELYEKKKVRGLAVGRLIRNTCGACNMSLTASAAHDLLSRPNDELITCPECSAILVRN